MMFYPDVLADVLDISAIEKVQPGCYSTRMLLCCTFNVVMILWARILKIAYAPPLFLFAYWNMIGSFTLWHNDTLLTCYWYIIDTYYQNFKEKLL